MIETASYTKIKTKTNTQSTHSGSAETTRRTDQAARCHPVSEATNKHPDSKPFEEDKTFHKVHFLHSTRF